MSLLPGARSRVIHIVVVTASLWPWSNYQSTEQEISDEKMDRECWRQDGTLECYSGQAMTSNVAQAFFTLGHIRWNLQEMETLQRKWRSLTSVYAFSRYFPCHFQLASPIIHQFPGLWLVTWPEYCPLIGQYRAHLLAPFTWVGSDNFLFHSPGSNPRLTQPKIVFTPGNNWSQWDGNMVTWSPGKPGQALSDSDPLW